MTSPQEYCKQITNKSGSSFYYSFLFLSPEKRTAITAVYAFCRIVDDIVDECRDQAVAEAKLIWWEKELTRVFKQQAQHPVGIALQQVLVDFSLPQELFRDIIYGVAMDLTYKEYRTFDDLQIYGYRVASTVGMISAKIFGYQDQNTIEYAKNLGLSLQLVNIIRDLSEDLTRGRIYIPQDELKQFNINPQQLLDKCVPNQNDFRELMKFQALRARDYYTKALELLPAVDRFAQKSGLIMANIYFKILDNIEDNKFDVLKQKISVTPIKKLWIAWSTLRQEKKKYRQLEACEL